MLEIKKNRNKFKRSYKKNLKMPKGLTINSFSSNYFYLCEDNGKIVAFLYGDKALENSSSIDFFVFNLFFCIVNVFMLCPKIDIKEIYKMNIFFSFQFETIIHYLDLS